MSEKNARFPLTLSSVVQTKKREEKRAETYQRPLASLQTAAKNAAASHIVQKTFPVTSKHIQPGMTSEIQKTYALKTPSVTLERRSTSLVSDAVRRAMVERVAHLGVKNEKVLTALQVVPRHLFLDPALASQAYINASLPIGFHQTISQPYIVARMIEVLLGKKEKLNRVLEIGTGCGYQAAVLSQVADSVYSIERILPLHEMAKKYLRPLRIANIRMHYGDGMLGLPDVAPFDGIILAAAGLNVPRALLQQMAVGGRLVAPVGDEQQELQLIERVSTSEWTTTVLEKCHFVPLRPGTT